MDNLDRSKLNPPMNPPMNPIVSADWLRLHLDDPQIVIVDCRFSLMEPDSGIHQYETSHIPGSYYLHLNDDLAGPVQRHGGRHPLPDLEIFVSKLRQMGINDDTWVVCYDSARLSYASRAWWLLRYLGHDRTLLLNGGWQAWTAMHYPISKEKPTSKENPFNKEKPPSRSGQFTPNIQSHWTVDIEQVKAGINRPGTVLVDSRETVRYRGDREPIDPVAGHIPSALSYPWQQVTNERGFISVEMQADRWTAIQDEAEIIVYCGSGVTACVNLLSLSIAGLDAKLYVGSWSDWCSYL
jgi:thiosulfate/3-mercaptopyruvate sulfurtransferase